MGTWGTGIYSNDVSEEVRDTYKDLLKDGKSNDDALLKTLEEGKDYLNDSDDTYGFWLALADTQSSLGRLHPQVKERALELIEKGGDIGRWLEVGDQKNAKKRQEVLDKLKEKLTGSQPPEKNIPRRVVFKCPWQIGDVFAYLLESEEAQKNGLLGHYLIIQKIKDKNWLHGGILPMVIVRMSRTNELPKLEDIEDLEIVKILESERGFHASARVIESTSMRNIPKKLIYLGNSTKGLEEFYSIEAEKISYSYDIWKTFECSALNEYVSFNIKNHPNVFVVPKFDRQVMEEIWEKFRKGSKN